MSIFYRFYLINWRTNNLFRILLEENPRKTNLPLDFPGFSLLFYDFSVHDQRKHVRETLNASLFYFQAQVQPFDCHRLTKQIIVFDLISIRIRCRVHMSQFWVGCSRGRWFLSIWFWRRHMIFLINLVLLFLLFFCRESF